MWGWNVPSVFGYTSTRMLLAAITSLLFCIFMGPLFIRALYRLKIGQKIRVEECPPLGELHRKKQDTPTMGGVLILSGMLLSLVLWMDFRSSYTWIFLLVTLVLGGLGGWDDFLKVKFKNAKGISASKKLRVQTLLALLVASYLIVPSVSNFVEEWTTLKPPVIKMAVSGSEAELPKEMKTLSQEEAASKIYFPFMKMPIELPESVFFVLLVILFDTFVIVGASNSVNLTDGLDGLASGCLIMVALTLGLVAFLSNNLDIALYLNIPYISYSGEVGVYMAALAGACLGFLWYNAPPAQVFMGDVGSLALGGIIGVAALMIKKEILLGLVGGVFMAEALSVILQVASFRYRNKKRIFLIAPLHHHFEYKGWAESKVVVRFWIVSLLLAFIAIASLKFQ